jgi:hypothetical protein
MAFSARRGPIRGPMRPKLTRTGCKLIRMNAGESPQQNASGATGGRAVAGSNPVSPITESPAHAGFSCLWVPRGRTNPLDGSHARLWP